MDVTYDIEYKFNFLMSNTIKLFLSNRYINFVNNFTYGIIYIFQVQKYIKKKIDELINIYFKNKKVSKFKFVK